MEARHFKMVAEASARFDQYMASVRNTDIWNAADKRNRKDDFVDLGRPNGAGLRYANFKETRETAKANKQSVKP